MQRGSDKHGPRADEALQSELRGQIGKAGGHREDWLDPERPAEDEPAFPAVPEDPERAPRD